MTKSILILSLGLTTALGNLHAQETPMLPDSMKVSANKMKPDSMRTSEDKMTMDNVNKTEMEKENKMTMQTDNAMSMDKKAMMKPDLNSWPKASKMAVEEITAKYGKPDVTTMDELIWKNKGVWKKICITKNESKHSFPVEHTDMMQQTISHKVPQDKMDDLGKFDGSVTFDRTQGTLSARCDVEANNFLALNLAHDIITGKKTYLQARATFASMVKEKMNGGNPAYMQKLSFSPAENAADPDKNTTGLTKEDVMNGMKKTAKN